MRNDFTPLKFKTGRWLTDTDTHASLLVQVPELEVDLHLTLSNPVTQANGTSIVQLSLRADVAGPNIYREIRLNLRSPQGQPFDLFMALSVIVMESRFQRDILTSYVAAMQVQGFLAI